MKWGRDHFHKFLCCDLSGIIEAWQCIPWPSFCCTDGELFSSLWTHSFTSQFHSFYIGLEFTVSNGFLSALLPQEWTLQVEADWILTRTLIKLPSTKSVNSLLGFCFAFGKKSKNAFHLGIGLPICIDLVSQTKVDSFLFVY